MRSASTMWPSFTAKGGYHLADQVELYIFRVYKPEFMKTFAVFKEEVAMAEAGESEAALVAGDVDKVGFSAFVGHKAPEAAAADSVRVPRAAALPCGDRPAARVLPRHRAPGRGHGWQARQR